MLEKGGTTAASETGRRALSGGGPNAGPATCPAAPPRSAEGALEGVCRDVL